jgi:hypothetical protein
VDIHRSSGSEDYILDLLVEGALNTTNDADSGEHHATECKFLDRLVFSRRRGDLDLTGFLYSVLYGLLQRDDKADEPDSSAITPSVDTSVRIVVSLDGTIRWFILTSFFILLM